MCAAQGLFRAQIQTQCRLGWIENVGPARQRWETRLATGLGLVLLVCAMPAADQMTGSVLSGVLLVAASIVVYALIAGRLLAVADRRRGAHARSLT